MTPLVIALESGRVRLDAGPAIALRGALPELAVALPGERLDWRPAALTADGEQWTADWPQTGLRIVLRSEARDGALVLHSALEHHGRRTVALIGCAPLGVAAPGTLRIGDSPARWAVYRNGYQSWSGTRAYGVEEADADPRLAFLRDMQTDPVNQVSGRRGDFRSDLVTAIVDRASGAAFAAGFLETARFTTGVEVNVPRRRFERWAAVVDGDRIPLRPGTRLELPPLWLAAGDDGWALLAAWAAACGAAMQARVAARAPLGWCSWYYYFTAVRERDVLDNLEQLRALRSRIRCEYVQVDDGYQRAIGDWLESNEKFPHGMRWLAQRIQGAGFDAGIWLAPFLVRPESRLFAARPEWLLRTASGRLRSACWNPAWGLARSAYALDTSRDDVCDWLRELARTIVHQWGYRILKLDFLYAAALPAVRANPDVTRAAALRRGLQAIREGAGEDAFLLGCGCPLGPAIGIVDGMRIGPDVAPFWENWISRRLNRGRHGVATAHALRNVLTRAFMHRRLWLNDPDCLLVRSGETQLSADEVRSLATAIALTDGMFVLGDRLDTLTGERLAWIERVLPLLGGTARVEDLFTSPFPERLRASYAEGEAAAVFNFGARSGDRAVAIPSGRVATEVWSEAELPVTDGEVRLAGIPPHGCRLLWLPRPPAVDEPVEAT